MRTTRMQVLLVGSAMTVAAFLGLSTLVIADALPGVPLFDGGSPIARLGVGSTSRHAHESVEGQPPVAGAPESGRSAGSTSPDSEWYGAFGAPLAGGTSRASGVSRAGLQGGEGSGTAAGGGGEGGGGQTGTPDAAGDPSGGRQNGPGPDGRPREGGTSYANTGGNVAIPNASRNRSNDPSATNSSSGTATITTGTAAVRGDDNRGTTETRSQVVALAAGQTVRISFTGDGTLTAYLLAPGQARHAPTDTPVVHCATACEATYEFTNRNAGFRLEIVSSVSGRVTLS